jgi:hypothetical protein
LSLQPGGTALGRGFGYCREGVRSACVVLKTGDFRQTYSGPIRCDRARGIVGDPIEAAASQIELAYCNGDIGQREVDVIAITAM